MYYDNLPIYKSALDLVVYIETIVKGFNKYHKYTIGEDMRKYLQFEYSSLLSVAVCKQSQSWLKNVARVTR